MSQKTDTQAVYLTASQIELIKSALHYVYDCKMNIIRQNRPILSEGAVKEILNEANQYFTLQDVFE